MLILNEDAFDEKNIKKAGYEIDPRESEELDGYRVFQVPMEKLTKEALQEFDLPGRAVLRSKNMIALGLISWTFNRDLKDTENWINDKFKNLPEVAKANIKALKTGYNFGITVEAFHHTYKVDKASLPAGEYTNINGNIGLSWGLIAGAKKANLDLFYGSYPITPASDILHELSKHKNFNVLTFQAEDEIAAAAAAVGASFTGKLAVTGTSGPGLALKSETISLALSAELPLVVVNVQRGGPSTGLPTKPEQSDLMFAMYGRHGEAPLPVIAAKSPSHAFYAAFEATRIALKYMTPVILLSDNYVATGSEPWKLPEIENLDELGTNLTTTYNTENGFLPFFRDYETNARPWAIPGVPGLEHRVGGLEKEDGTGNVSYDTDNHQYMTDMRAWKIENIANDIDPLEINGDISSDTLILGWGSTFGGITQAVNRLNSKGVKVASAHFTHVNPFPDNTAEVLSQFKNIIVPELNTGQLSKLLRARYLVDTVGINKVEGLPFTAQELEEKIESLINSFGTKLEPIVEVVAEEEPVVEEVVEEVVAEEEPQEEVGIPEHLIMRSAEARAKALGIPVEQVLEEMSADKPAAETQEPIVEEEPVVEEVKSDTSEEPAAEAQEPVVERVVERVTERVTERIIEKVDETLPENKELVKDVEEERNKVEEEKKEEVKTDE
jgi:2-oxoglutarate ferredoxin oxidoreductase subunit alpha